jgi:DNA-binding SARP family transcriptional activator
VTDLRLALLGSPIVERDGAVVGFDTKKATALLALLAVTGREQSRERLAALLWPDSDNARARGSLRRTLSVTAAAMGEGLAISRLAVALKPQQVRVDVTDFEALAARRDASSLERAVRLHRDDFLAGFSLRGCEEFEDWQSATADRFRQVLAGTLERLVAACAAAGETQRALEHARRWLSLDPLHEPAHQAVIRLLGWTGQRSAALRQYRALVRILDTELAVRPLPETTRLYDDVRAGRLAPQRAPGAPPGGAPPGGTRPGGTAQPATPASGPAQPGSVQPGSVQPGSVQAGSVQAGPVQVNAVQVGTAQAGSAQAGPGRGVWPLLGRAADMAALDAAWRAVTASGPCGQVVAVVGEAGCGKTRLIEEFRASVAAAGGTVLAGRCHDGESGLPFALAADLLRAAGSACPDLPDRLPAHAAAMVGRLAPELAQAHSGDPASPLSSPVALTRLYAATGTALLLAADRPVVVIAEDLHWADGPSLDLLCYLLHRPAAWPMLLVLSWRQEHVERLRGIQAALAEAVDSGRGRSITPRPLRAEEIAEILRGAGVSGADASRLLAETRGLPLLVREYAEALRSEAVPAEVDDGAAERWSPPETVRVLLSRRLQAAGEAARQMLSTAAVLGSGCDCDLLRLVSGRGETETVEALEEAVARFLLTELPPARAGEGPSYDFPYEAMRRVAYESASLARRRLLHGRAAGALAARYERDPHSVRAAVVAGHLQRAGRDAEAARWWWRAAQRSRELYAHADAYTHLRQAVALGYPQVECSVALGDVLTVLGRYREALAEYEAAAASGEAAAESSAAPGGDGSRGDGGPGGGVSASIEHKLAEVHHRLGEWELADAHLAAAADLLPPGDLGGRARVGADRAVVAYRRGGGGEAASLGRDALGAARSVGDPAALAQALNVLGMLAARRGDPARAEEYLRESLAHARGLPESGPAVAALNNLARLLAETGRAADALAFAEEALTLGSELGDQHRVAALHTNLADLLHASGQRDAAIGHLKEAARRFAAVDPGGPPRPEIWTLVEW